MMSSTLVPSGSASTASISAVSSGSLDLGCSESVPWTSICSWISPSAAMTTRVRDTKVMPTAAWRRATPRSRAIMLLTLHVGLSAT